MIVFQTEPIIRHSIMGYKHTFEIITKDIQDIEKLVGNFENYSEIPHIELDLALSKLRNVYEILLMFRDGANMTSALSQPAEAGEKAVPSSPPAEKPVTPPPAEDAAPVPPTPEPPAPPRDEPPKAEVFRTEPQPAPPDKSTSPEPPKHEPVVTPETAGKILAEKFKREQAFINEKLGEKTQKHDLSSRLQSAPIASISGSMGINDKFFFIRELFNGDAGKFRATMDNLEHASTFSEAVNFLNDNFEWDMESKEVQQLLALVKRKFVN